ncbi:GHMP family kinase ATP-binding protein [Bradyrhizobium sp. BR 1432]|uniref:GHMP family kinase ATP-binding protein n=1 Tax=Bradyrhizobium sp. BR 1432 TaxID=3447966 RepID=UPI003EE64F89
MKVAWHARNRSDIRISSPQSVEPTIIREYASRQDGYSYTRPLAVAGAGGVGVGHHGEILQGAFRDAAGQIHRGLVTLPCSRFNCVAWAAPRSEPSVDVDPPDKSKVRRAIALLLSQIGAHALGLSIRLRSNIPVGYGLGSSTADIVAALKAAAAVLSIRLTPANLLKLCVTAEEASDGTMFTSRAVLAAHRKASSSRTSDTDSRLLASSA